MDNLTPPRYPPVTMEDLCLKRRCAICHFDFVEKDLITAVAPGGRKFPPFEYHPAASVNSIYLHPCAEPCSSSHSFIC
uniref:Uncharacterized protein n=1 Tax=Gibberella zeae TaxID=5518 RepID=A0A4E9DM62_GIBZA